MKIKYTINAMVLIIIALTHVNCNSPSSQGKSAGEVFCDCIDGNINPNQSVSTLFAERDSCEALATKQLKIAEDHYQTDGEKLSEVDKAYKNTTWKIYADYYDALSKAITKAFSQSTWVREGTTSIDNYLFSFASNMITPLNERGSLEYKISGDTMVLNDDKKTRLLIHFEKDGKLNLSNPEKTSTVNYHLASDKDKLIGYWTAQGGMTYIGETLIEIFKPDGNFASEIFGNREYSYDYVPTNYGTYKWEGNELVIADGEISSKDKVVFQNNDQLSLPNRLSQFSDGIYDHNPNLIRSKSNSFLNIMLLYRG